MNILITGAAGFLGRELVSHLLGLGHSVVGLAHSESRYQEISFSEDNGFRKHYPINRTIATLLVENELYERNNQPTSEDINVNKKNN